MQITQTMFESYLHCPFKCFRYADNTNGPVSEFTEWQQIQHEYEQSAWKRLYSSFSPDMTFWGNPPGADLQSHRYKVIGRYEISSPQIQSRLHAIQLMDLATGGRRQTMYVPLRFIIRETLSDKDRLCLAFDAVALSSNGAQVPQVGKIIHGRNYQTVTVNLHKLITKARQTIFRIRQHDTRDSPPPLILNRHCAECEFQVQCRAVASEKDDLSLLANFSEKEWKQQHEKGIFTVTQLSYTFRPRKRPTILSIHQQHALKALAIRTNKIHVFGSVVKDQTQGVPVFIDVEGDPDRSFYYLIGVRVWQNSSYAYHSFWADDPSEERRIWVAFLQTLTSFAGATLYHYGSYETTFFKRLRKRYGDTVTPVVESLLDKSVNVLSFIRDHIYFPTYSNSLKEIAHYLGFRWSEDSASGYTALIWRSQFESSGDPALRARLVKYNAEDCEALQIVAERVWALTAKAQHQEADVIDATSIKREYPHRFGVMEFALPQFKAINEASYWDYQRTKVYVRTLSPSSKLCRPTAISRKRVRPNKVVSVHERRPKHCPWCGGTVIYKWGTLSQTIYDLKLSGTCIKRWIVQYVFQRFLCWNCRRPIQLYYHKLKYGPALVGYFLYQLLEMRLPLRAIIRSMTKLFGMQLSPSHLKAAAAERYRPTYDRIISRIVRGKLIQADETKARIDGHDTYVWVFTTLQDVAFIYRPTREAEFLHEFLEGFAGVLVSDFYSGYDSIPCVQQKCLIHLMRDLNDDLRKMPFNTELTMIAEAFAELLKAIVATVDRFGLKKRHLQKHKVAAERFLDKVVKADPQTDIAIAFKHRFERNRDTLFTFLDYDGVPWNNNNAEHAIKAFVRLRRTIGGSSTAKGIEEYLILLSISETCKAKGIDVLDFFLCDNQDALIN